MVTIQIKNIEGNTVLPIRGTERAAGYDIIAVDDPIIVGEKLEDGSYSKIDYIEYHTALYISPQDNQIAHNGVREHYHTLLHPRSSVRKYNLLLANSIGLVDNDYRGEIIMCYKYVWQPEDFKAVIKDAVIEFPDSTKIPIRMATGEIIAYPNLNKIYKKGDKIGQLVTELTNPTQYVLVNELNQTNRGTGGFGSTDKGGVDVTEPTVQPTEAKPAGGYIAELYRQSGGIPVKQRYSEEIKQRDS
jgi:dUTP pyrophosphatase